jgi:hypothetical protein
MLKLSLASVACAALIGCASAPIPAPIDPSVACSNLKATIDASKIGLPTSGVTIDSATFTAPVEASVAERGPTPAATINPALPEMCRVVGRILPIDPSAPPIMFQVNLPTQWNGKSLQLGGGGFNGNLITGLQHPAAMPFGSPSPLARGYVTVGTDSGHQNAPNVPLQAFAANQEALVNFAHASYKKVRDVAMELIVRRYGQKSSKHYFMGSSEGGREALTMAQRYPSDFDGVFARVPVINWVGLQHAYLPPNFAMMQPGGWLSPAHVAVLGNYVNVICDVDDGAADGIIGDSNACAAKIDIAGVKCSPGQASETCLNDAQIRAAKLHHARYQFDFPLANGVRSYPGRPLGGEATPGTGSTGGWVTWMTGQDAPAWPATAKNSNGWNYGSGTIAHFILRDANADVMKYNPNDHRARILEISALMDSTNPDLSAFRERGGKVIMLEYMADYAQSPFAGIEYFQSVQKKMGVEKTNEFVRLFTAPGVDHVGTGAPGNVDMLAALEEWVERGAAPTNLTVIEQPNVAPFGTRRSRPLCEWPLTPKHTGKGNPGVAASWACGKS